MDYLLSDPEKGNRFGCPVEGYSIKGSVQFTRH